MALSFGTVNKIDVIKIIYSESHVYICTYLLNLIVANNHLGIGNI